MPKDKVECVVDCRNTLGEGPVWDTRDNALYWADIRAPALQRLDPSSGRVDVFPMPRKVGSFAPRTSGGFLVALADGFHAFDPATGACTPIHNPEPHLPANRMNDGKCDRRGRFIVGTMEDHGGPVGSLYRLDPDLSCHRLRGDIIIPNSSAWSPDDRTFYFADTARGAILAFDYDIDQGTLGLERVLLAPGLAPGYPDGATVDEAGCLWSARYDGGAVVRITPDGRIDRVVSLPVSQVTCCAFGGPGLATLYITTASQEFTEEQRAAEPLAGGLFAVDVGVKGLPEPHFAG